MDKYIKSLKRKRSHDKISSEYSELSEEDFEEADGILQSKKTRPEEIICSINNTSPDTDVIINEYHDSKTTQSKVDNCKPNNEIRCEDKCIQLSMDKISNRKRENSQEKEAQDESKNATSLFITRYTNWNYKTVLLPDIAKRTEIEISAPSEHLLPNCIRLSKNKYKFDVRYMRNIKQVDSQDELLEHSYRQIGWKASIKVTIYEHTWFGHEYYFILWYC